MSDVQLPLRQSDFLAYVSQEEHLDIAASSTKSNIASGLVIRSKDPLGSTRWLRRAGYILKIVPDCGAWAREFATPDDPTMLEGSESLFSVGLDEWARPQLNAGANAVLTPSKLLPAGQWATLRAVLRAGEATDLAEVITLVATDVRMLGAGYQDHFIETVAATPRPLAFVFADDRGKSFAQRDQLRGLRRLLEARPDSLLMATEPVVAADAYAHGLSAAAIGINSSARRPYLPGKSGGCNSRGFIPGLFLRELWEHRSPAIYADWYANSPSPTCAPCGRALDAFGTSEADKAAVLKHNVHAWLDLANELRLLTPAERHQVLMDERTHARIAHLQLRPGTGPVELDAVLRALIEIDDRHGRRVSPAGQLLP